MRAKAPGPTASSHGSSGAWVDQHRGHATALLDGLECARWSAGQEADFWRVLLAAPVWALSIDGLWHCTAHPDGFQVVPFFTCVQRARETAPCGARLVQSIGRVWLQAMSGCTVMLEPDHGGCLLLPEEVALLLKCGTLPPVRRGSWAGEPAWIRRGGVPSAAVLALLRGCLARADGVDKAYLLETRASDAHGVHRPVLVLIVSAGGAERAARACLATLAPTLWAKGGLDVTVHDPGQALPAFLRRARASPIFVRPHAAS